MDQTARSNNSSTESFALAQERPPDSNPMQTSSSPVTHLNEQLSTQFNLLFDSVPSWTEYQRLLPQLTHSQPSCSPSPSLPSSLTPLSNGQRRRLFSGALSKGRSVSVFEHSVTPRLLPGSHWAFYGTQPVTTPRSGAGHPQHGAEGDFFSVSQLPNTPGQPPSDPSCTSDVQPNGIPLGLQLDDFSNSSGLTPQALGQRPLLISSGHRTRCTDILSKSLPQEFVLSNTISLPRNSPELEIPKLGKKPFSDNDEDKDEHLHPVSPLLPALINPNHEPAQADHSLVTNQIMVIHEQPITSRSLPTQTATRSLSPMTDHRSLRQAMFQRIKRVGSHLWIFLGKWTPWPGTLAGRRNVFKAALAFTLASLFSFHPMLHQLVGESPHLVANAILFFNPVRSRGAFIEAGSMGVLGLVFAAVVAYTGLCLSTFLTAYDELYMTSKVVSLALFCFLPIFVLAYVKANLGRQAIYTGNSIAHIMLLTVLTRETSIVHLDGTVDSRKTEDNATALLMGLFISVVVGWFLWPQRAYTRLRRNIQTTLESCKLLLGVAVDTFIMDGWKVTIRDPAAPEVSIDPVEFYQSIGGDSPAVTMADVQRWEIKCQPPTQEARDRLGMMANLRQAHRQSFAALEKALDEARLEFSEYHVWRFRDTYKSMVKCLNRLSQQLGSIYGGIDIQVEWLSLAMCEQPATHDPMTESPQQSPESTLRPLVLKGPQKIELVALVHFTQLVQASLRSLNYKCQEVFTSLNLVVEASFQGNLGQSTVWQQTASYLPNGRRDTGEHVRADQPITQQPSRAWYKRWFTWMAHSFGHSTHSVHRSNFIPAKPYYGTFEHPVVVQEGQCPGPLGSACPVCHPTATAQNEDSTETGVTCPFHWFYHTRSDLVMALDEFSIVCTDALRQLNRIHVDWTEVPTCETSSVTDLQAHVSPSPSVSRSSFSSSLSKGECGISHPTNFQTSHFVTQQLTTIPNECAWPASLRHSTAGTQPERQTLGPLRILKRSATGALPSVKGPGMHTDPHEHLFNVSSFVFSTQEFVAELLSLLRIVEKLTVQQTMSATNAPGYSATTLRTAYDGEHYFYRHISEQPFIVPGYRHSRPLSAVQRLKYWLSRLVLFPVFFVHQFTSFLGWLFRPPRDQQPLAFEPSSLDIPGLHNPVPTTPRQRRQHRMWRLFLWFRWFQTKYAFKAATIATLLSLPAFVEAWNPTFCVFRGEWSVITALVVMTPTVGGSNSISVYRILGTIMGGLAAFCIFILCDEAYLPTPPVLKTVFEGLIPWAGVRNILTTWADGLVPFPMVFPICLFLVSLPGFHIFLNTTYPKVGQYCLITFSVVLLNKVKGGEDAELPIGDIAWKRSVAVAFGVVVGVLTTSYVLPFEARVEVRKGLSRLLVNMSLFYDRLLTTFGNRASNKLSLTSRPLPVAQAPSVSSSTNRYSEANSEMSQPLVSGQHSPRLTALSSQTFYKGLESWLEPDLDTFLEMELGLQVSLLNLQSLLPHTHHEPRLKGPYPTGEYRRILSSCQIILDKLMAVRGTLVKQTWHIHQQQMHQRHITLPHPENEEAAIGPVQAGSSQLVATAFDSLEHHGQVFIKACSREHAQLVGCILLYFYILASACQLKTPLPAFLPPLRHAHTNLVQRMRKLDHQYRQRTASALEHLDQTQGNTFSKDVGQAHRIADENRKAYDTHYLFVAAQLTLFGDIVDELEYLGQCMYELFARTWVRAAHRGTGSLGNKLRPLLTPLNATFPKALEMGQCTRTYHDEGAYGFRLPKTPVPMDYGELEITNRIAHAGLVRLVNAFRDHGHKVADLDPLGMTAKPNVPELDPARYGLTDSRRVFPLHGILHMNRGDSTTEPLAEASLESIVAHLHNVYCRSTAVEFSHIPDSGERRWLSHLVESFQRQGLEPQQKRRIFQLLARAEVFDHFMQKKFPQVKRYGLEGAESMMVLLDELFYSSNVRGVQDIVLCMAHRGRLNLLTGLLQLSPEVLFHKVKGNSEFPPDVPATGDVLSHLTSAPTLDYGTGLPLHVSLLPNPSHLEAVNPVAMGKARAKQMQLFDRLGDAANTSCELGDRVMCVQLHGDAAFTGQGVVMETLGLSNLPHFSSGGSVHIIVNNQLGYTTPALNARSTVYTSDIGKMVNAPVFHVNGDRPEDVARTAQLALAYRQQFKRDVIVDLLTFRRWGHNELDEPAYTQPLMYRNIRARDSVPQLYQKKLLKEPQPVLKVEAMEAFRQDYFTSLIRHLEASASYRLPPVVLQKNWRGLVVPLEITENVNTGVSKETLVNVGQGSVVYPSDITIHPRLEKYHVQGRLKRLAKGDQIDWATAEALAMGSLLVEGYNVRISGQDVGRGTFSQRHAMVVCQETEQVYLPLNHLTEKQGRLEVANSHLSELAVLGFEYGMSLETPHRLVIWEAQYGDFFNTAQVIVDTFIVSGNTKWLRQTGLIMLLPHGYDGTGPEHSSCRIERFLQLSNDPMHYDPNSGTGDSYGLEPRSGLLNPNLHVVNCTTPAQYFHVLRRQLKRNYRKPLVVAAPKTLLRSPLAISSLDDMAPGTTFQPVLTQPGVADPTAVRRLVFVSGRIYYDLHKRLQELSPEQQREVTIIRLEELSPFPREALVRELAKFTNVQEYIWCQEETENAGAYSYVLPRLEFLLPKYSQVHYVGRPPLAAAVTGIGMVYRKEQAKILHNAFAPLSQEEL
ncbi:hypothetical protein IWQ61_006754 [Dispira simplex]|nr:hypothetical protein IWQ61_006754 [Dispira simplex]